MHRIENIVNDVHTTAWEMQFFYINESAEILEKKVEFRKVLNIVKTQNLTHLMIKCRDDNTALLLDEVSQMIT